MTRRQLTENFKTKIYARCQVLAELVKPHKNLEKAFLKMLLDFEKHDPENGEYYASAKKDFDAYCKRLNDEALGIVEEGRVPQTTRWLQIETDEIVGVVRIRHHIDHPFLAAEGGHIGYDVAPSHRRKGYGTQMLSLSLAVAKKIGIEKALLIADEVNVASIKVIENCGGVHERTLISEHFKVPIVRYWIDVT